MIIFTTLFNIMEELTCKHQCNFDGCLCFVYKNKLVRLSFQSMFSTFILYSSGHHPTFTNLQWTSAFVGFDDMNVLISVILVLFNTFSGYILVFCWFYYYNDNNNTLRNTRYAIFFFPFININYKSNSFLIVSYNTFF